MLLWLWCRLEGTAPIQPLTLEPPYVASVALKIKKKKEGGMKYKWISWPSPSLSFCVYILHTHTHTHTHKYTHTLRQVHIPGLLDSSQGSPVYLSYH